MDVHGSVGHDPVFGSRSNQILQFRTESGSDWILKETLPDRICWSLQWNVLSEGFSGYKTHWMKY